MNHARLPPARIMGADADDPPSPSLVDLSREVLAEVFGFLDDLRDAASLATTCRATNEAADEGGGWKRVSAARWGITRASRTRGGGCVRVWAEGMTFDVEMTCLEACVASRCAPRAQCLALPCRGPFEKKTLLDDDDDDDGDGGHPPWDGPRGSWRALACILSPLPAMRGGGTIGGREAARAGVPAVCPMCAAAGTYVGREFSEPGIPTGWSAQLMLEGAENTPQGRPISHKIARVEGGRAAAIRLCPTEVDAAGPIEGEKGRALFRSNGGEGIADRLVSVCLSGGRRYTLGGYPLRAAGVAALDCLPVGKNCRVAHTRVGRFNDVALHRAHVFWVLPPECRGRVGDGISTSDSASEGSARGVEGTTECAERPAERCFRWERRYDLGAIRHGPFSGGDDASGALDEGDRDHLRDGTNGTNEGSSSECLGPSPAAVALLLDWIHDAVADVDEPPCPACDAAACRLVSTAALRTRWPLLPELAADRSEGGEFEGELFVCRAGAHVWGFRRQGMGGTLLSRVELVTNGRPPLR